MHTLHNGLNFNKHWSGQILKNVLSHNAQSE